MIAPDAVPTWSEAVIRLLAATGIGGAIGLNRELTRKPAGLRTHALVALGSGLVTVTALQLGPGAGGTNADAISRVIQGLIVGIGFVGGGVILHTEGRSVSGLTTASTIWVAAGLGISCGLGTGRSPVSRPASPSSCSWWGAAWRAGCTNCRESGTNRERGTGNREPGTDHQ